MPQQLDAFARQALGGHGLAPDSTLTLLNVSENATFAVDDPVSGQRSALRLHRPGYHSLAAIESELQWIAALRRGGVVRTPAVLPAPDGSRVVAARVGGLVRQSVRFAWADGDEPAGPRLVDDFATLGRIAASLHAHTRTWSRPRGFTRFTWDCDTAIGARGHWGRWQDGIAVGPGEHAVLARLAARLRHRLAAFGAGPDRFGLVHADLRLANLLVCAGSDEMTVIDFDDSGFGWYLYDLGASLSFIEDDPGVPELIDSWVGGYRSVAPLSTEEAAELPTFVMLRRLLLVAWIGSHSETELARDLGAPFTAASCDLAEAYLSRF